MRFYKQTGDRVAAAHTSGHHVETLESRIKLSCGCAAHDPLADAGVAALDVPVAAAPEASPQQAQGPRRGSGIVLDNLTDVSLPIIGDLGDFLIIDQAVITDIRLVEDVVGQIIGLEVTGNITGVLQVLGEAGVEVDEQFTSTLSITSSGPGKCELVTLDLGPLNIDALGLVTADVEEVEVSGRGSGAVGVLLCTLASLLRGLTGGGAGGLVNAVDNQI